MNNFISNLSLRRKFLYVTLAMLLPLLVLFFTTVRLELADIGVARHEDRGLRWASQLIAVGANLSEYREHAVAVGAGAEGERSEMMEHAGLIRGAAQALDKLAAEGDAEFIAASGWNDLQPRIAAALDGNGAD